MELRFKTTYVNDELKYAVGLVGPNGAEEYAMRVLDPTHIIMTDPETWTPGTDPSALFGLTEEEYNWKDTDLEKLDELAQKLRTDIPTDRLIAERDGVRKKDRVESIDYGKYVRYRKERNEQRRDALIARMLGAEELYCMYCGETNKPYVFQYSFIQMFEDKATAMELANEYRKRNIPLLVSTFTRDQFNRENEKSVFQELQVLGYQIIMFFDAEKRQGMIPIKEIVKHSAYIGQKNNLIYGNPKVDFAITNLFQFLRTPNNIDRTDPEKFKEAVAKTLAFMESRLIEALSDARFLVPTKAMPDGKVIPAMIKMSQKKPAAAAAEGAEEAAKTEVAEETIEKNFLPVFTNGMEFVSDKDQYKAAVVPLDDIIKMVREVKLDGILINMKSKCAMPCGEERFAQVEKFREWKAEHMPDAAQNEEVPDTLEAPAEAGNDEAPADTPFVPIVNKNNE
ncbi:MAG: SseB family protein [Clostridia bacterium]|nr:SseB family protein [Clostridia bacterium]